MKNVIFCLCLFLTVPSLLFSQVVSRTKSFRSVLPRSTVANLPPSPAIGKVHIVTDGINVSDCVTGTGSNEILCHYNGTNWVTLGDGAGGSTETLDSAFDNGKVIDGANSQANAFSVGDGTDGFRFYVTGGNPTRECFKGAGTCDQFTEIPSGKIGGWKDSASAEINKFDQAATPTRTYGTSYLVPKDAWFPAEALYLQGAATLTTDSAIITGGLNSSYITVTDVDTDGLHAYFPFPGGWNAGTIRVTLWGVDDASTFGTLELDFSAECFTPGADAIATTISATGEQAAQIVFDTADRIESVETAAITVNGTCAKGDIVGLQGQVDATATTDVSGRIIGIEVEYLRDSPED